MSGISIIIPTYNSSKTLSNCLDSIICQTFKIKEIIIQDGKSTDSTLDILDIYVKKFPYISVKSEKDYGIYDAMNRGISRSSGEWLYFLGSDDSLTSSTILEEVSRSFNNETRIVYGKVKINGRVSWAEANSIYGKEIFREDLAGNNVCHQAVFYHRELFNKYGTYNLTYNICSDWDFNMRVFFKCKTTFVPLIICNFQGEGSSTSITDHAFGEDYDSKVYQNLFSNPFSKFYRYRLASLYKILLKKERKNLIEHFKLRLAIEYQKLFADNN